jgi:hypothetical protein
MEGGASRKLLVVGHEGFIGLALFLSGKPAPRQAFMHSAGHAYRLIGQQLG